MINNRIKKFSVLLLVFSSFIFNAVLAQTVSIKTQTNVSCNGGTNGSFEVQVSGGSPVFRYSIFGGSPYQYSPVFSNLPAASYVVTVTDTLGGSDTVHVHVLDSGVYIGIKFTKLEKVLSVWIHQNYVDHKVELEGSLPVEEEENVWRTHLTTSSSPASKINKPAEVSMTVCPKCGLQYNRSLPQCTNCS